MKDAQKPDHITLGTLIGRLKEGRYVIPDFQRDFEWKPQDIRDLIKSVFLDYYVGSLLLWRAKDENIVALACEDLYGFNGSSQNREHIVLDGQQRLTALHYAFFAPDAVAPGRRNRYLYFIRVDRFMAGAYDDAFEYDWRQQSVRLLGNEKAQFENHRFPLAVVGKSTWEVHDWVKGYEEHWDERAAAASTPAEKELAQHFARDARDFGDHVRETMERYQISYVELDRDLEIEKVCDIFTQVNSKGVRLDIFDLINAMVKPRGIQLKKMWREAEPKLAFAGTSKMNVYVLQVMSILAQGYCSPMYLYYLLPGQEKKTRDRDGARERTVLVQDGQDFERRWNEAVDALEKAIKSLKHPQEFGAISPAYIPYTSIIPAFAALRAHAARLDPNLRLAAGRKIRHWYWASVFTERYSGSVESTAARDFIDVTEWFEDEDLAPALLDDFRAQIEGLDLYAKTRRGSSVYNGVFNLLILSGARDWVTGAVPQHDELDDHHIVPRAWGLDNGLVNDIDTILNRTPLTAESNRNVVRNNLPNQYLPNWINENGEDTVREILESHLISPLAFEILLRDPFTVDDFEAFIFERRKTITDRIRGLLTKDELKLPADLRDLDEQIERIELDLRSVVAERLDGDPSRVPSHVRERIRERLRAASRRNPAFDSDHYESLSGSLEYFDLRELQDTISNKALWPEFEPIFRVKEQLAIRFDQLAELRNGIRHSRTINDVTRKDGEVSLLWFTEVLQRADRLVVERSESS